MPSGLPHAALFHRLLRGAELPITVLTPNRRLAQSLTAEADRAQRAAGRASWEAPDILPWSAWLERCHEEALYSPRGAEVPALLTTEQATLVWEEALRASRWRDHVLSVPATAALALEGWELAHAWRIEDALAGWPGNADSEAFGDWCAHYRRRTARERWLDAARLPARVAEWIAGGWTAPPAALVLYGFQRMTPQQADLVAALERVGVSVFASGIQSVAGTVQRAIFDSPRSELEGAARWARARLEAAAPGAAPRIAVVVPELSERRAQVARLFARVLAPGGEAAAAPLFNLSLGTPLASFALVDAAATVLDLAAAPLAFDRVSRLLRSPFIDGAEAEMAARARLDVALRQMAPATLTLQRLRALLPEAQARRDAAPCPRLLSALDALAHAADERGRAPSHDWARRFTAQLAAMGFPGERALDSVEFQALAKWREVLADFAALGGVAPAWSSAEARARLKRLCGDTLFQPASGEAPIQVLGILESAGLAFDHLWVSGLTEDAWPLAARPHPLIPAALQRKAGIAQATPELSLARDRALTEAWRGAAAEVVFTSARAEGERELLPSALTAGVPACEIAQLRIPDYATRRTLLRSAGRAPGALTLEADAPGPALGTATVRGGTAILADQAACAFRAFAHFRLEARALETPAPGLGAAERGQLLHAMMAHLWRELRDQARLEATPPERLAAIVEAAAAHAVAKVRAERPGQLEGRFAELERARLARIAHDWLAIERTRPAFEVRLSEEKMTLTAGSLRLEGRVDRIDRLADGGLAVIDYKSGAVSVSAWLGARPDDAQLPLYALAAGAGEIRAVAFARLKTGQLGFAGIAREDGVLPGVAGVERHRGARRVAASWTELLGHWRQEIDRLGESFARGDARINPKYLLATCERCDLKALCRVHERLGALADDDGREESE